MIKAGTRKDRLFNDSGLWQQLATKSAVRIRQWHCNDVITYRRQTPRDVVRCLYTSRPPRQQCAFYLLLANTSPARGVSVLEESCQTDYEAVTDGPTLRFKPTNRSTGRRRRCHREDDESVVCQGGTRHCRIHPETSSQGQKNSSP